jgi:hypothetical protein
MGLRIAQRKLMMKRFRLVSLLLTLLFLAWFASSAAAQTDKPLPETFVSDDETLTLRYPAGWVVEYEESGMVIIATSQDMIDLGDENVPPGEAAVAVLFSNTAADYMEEFFVGDDPVAILDNLIETVFSNNTGADVNIEFTTPVEITLNDMPAARSDGLFMGNHVFLIANEREDGSYSVIIGVTTVEELDKFEPKLLAIAESINFQPSSE